MKPLHACAAHMTKFMRRVSADVYPAWMHKRTLSWSQSERCFPIKPYESTRSYVRAFEQVNHLKETA